VIAGCGGPTPTEHGESSTFVACAAFAVTMLGVLLVWAPWVPAGRELLDFDGKPIPLMLRDASAQERLQRYKIFLGALALASLMALALPRRRAPETRVTRPFPTSTWLEAAAAVVLAVVVVGVTWVWLAPKMVPRTHMVLFSGFYGFYTQPSLGLVVAAALGGAVTLPLLWRFGSRLSLRAWWLLLGASTLVVTLPGLFEPIVLVYAAPGMLPFVEWHFDAVLGGVYTLAAGSSERHMSYTYLVSAIMALLQRQGGPLSFAADVRVVQGMNVAFALCVLWACYAWDRRRPLIALLTAALVLPWVSNNHLNIFFPNASGMRYLFLPLTVVWLRLSHGLASERAALAGGVFSALALLWNLETGVAVTAGVAVHLGARAERLRLTALVPLLGRYVGGLAAGLLGVGLMIGLGLGRWPLDLPRKLLDRTTIGASYGYPLYLDLMAIVIFGYVVWAVMGLVVARRAGPVASRAADRGALGVVALVWAAYYVLQPHPWNVWSYLLFGGLLLGDRLFPDGGPPPGARGLLRIAFVLAATIAVPTAVIGTMQTGYALERGSNLAGVAAHLGSARLGVTLSGVMVKAGDAAAVQSRAAHLATVPPDALVVTGNSYLLPKLTGRVELFPYRDLTYAATRSQLEQFATTIRARAPSMLLLDDPATLTGDDARRRYFERLAAELSDRYRLQQVVSGWSVYVPVP
jgi:hypothetical protein